MRRGDLVRLRSGGPLLTVVDVIEPLHSRVRINVAWFTDSEYGKQLKQANISIEAVKIVRKAGK